ncbi:hypothetical protein RV18_GL001504 [Enterococcus termitis]|nr:hypothetical protein RV18_GL001504 [Enterococcus termitis]
MDQANLSLTGYSIPLEKPIKKMGIELSPQLVNDNIECFGQSILADRKARQLIFIGVGSQGEVENTCILVGHHEEIEISINFNAYDSELSYFKNNFIFYKETYTNNFYEGNKRTFNRPNFIWGVKIELEKPILIEKLILPFHPGMHIFGIQLK